MNETCAECGIRFGRDHGYFLGSIYVNYGLTALIVAIAYPVLLLSGVIAEGKPADKANGDKAGLVVNKAEDAKKADGTIAVDAAKTATQVKATEKITSVGADTSNRIKMVRRIEELRIGPNDLEWYYHHNITEQLRYAGYRGRIGKPVGPGGARLAGGAQAGCDMSHSRVRRIRGLV